MQESSNAEKYPSNNFSQEQENQICVLINQLHEIVASNQIEESQKTAQFIKLLQPQIEVKCIKIASYLLALLQNYAVNKQNERSTLNACIVASFVIATSTQFNKCLDKLGKNELDAWGDYLETEDNGLIINCTVKFVEKLFLDSGYCIYAKSQKIFKAIVTKFHNITSDQIRGIATQVLIQMLLDNKKLLKYAQQPYFFLQFWLYQINQQTQLDRQLYWIDSVKKLYAIDTQAQDYLFHENDFKVFIDLLVRVMSQCPDGNKLKIPLECYLTLSCTKKMGIKILRIDDVKQFVMAIDGNALGIEDLCKEIRELQ